MSINTPSNNPLSIWHQLVQARNPAGLQELLAEDAVFYSPIVHTPKEGKVVTLMYLSSAFPFFFNDSFRYVRETTNDSSAILEFLVEMEGIIVNGVHIIGWNEAGQINEFKIMMRPQKAIDVVTRKMGEALQARNSTTA